MCRVFLEVVQFCRMDRDKDVIHRPTRRLSKVSLTLVDGAAIIVQDELRHGRSRGEGAACT